MESLDRTLRQVLDRQKNYIVTTVPEQLTSYLVQILVAVILIQDRYRMVHGDVHFDNILHHLP